MTTYHRLLQIPDRESFFLFGPRGIGKTTWLKKTYPQSIYIDLLDNNTFQKLLANPARLEEYIPPKYEDIIILDEVQRIPELLNEVHRLIETKKYHFIATGSSARKLRRQGVNLLAGRLLTYSMYPLTHLELGDDFDLQHSLRYGHLPTAYVRKSPKKYLESYISTYLQEEVQQEGYTRNLSGFIRFLEVASFSQGQVINMAKIARECHIQSKVVENYFSILEDLMIGYKLPVFTKKAKRRMIRHSKFYFFDVGVYRHIRPQGHLDMVEDVEGVALETLVFQELLALNSYFDWGYEFFFWRTSHGNEVDYILYGPKGIVALEVKRSKIVHPRDLKSLTMFMTDYPSTKGFLLYGGDEVLYYGDIVVVPMDKFLRDVREFLEDV